MGWQNPPIPWSELERKLSDRHRPGRPESGDGGDSPAWSRKRQPYVPPADLLPQQPVHPVVPYAELHCHTNFSFLDGASHPEDLVAEAVRLGCRRWRSPTTTASTAWSAPPRPPGRTACAPWSAPSCRWG